MNPNFDILNSFIDPILVINSKGEILYANNIWKEFAVTNQGNILKAGSGLDYPDLCKKITGEELPDVKAAMKGIRSVLQRKSKLFELEYPCHSADEEKWFLMRVSHVEADSEYTIISHINVTRCKRAEEEIKTINERMNTTMFRIAHDIQSPLQSIEGLIYLYNLKKTESARASYISLIGKSIGKLKEFIQNTLIVSGTVAKVDDIDFRVLLNDFMESIKYNEILKVIKVKVSIMQKEKFFSDKTEIISIISNVVSNSIKYHDPEKKEKRVEIDIRTSKTLAIISIKDNGIGMSKGTLSRVFELNYQSNKKSGNGAGVGLYLVHKSLEYIKGSIQVNSELAIGSEFIVSIPNLQNNAE